MNEIMTLEEAIKARHSVRRFKPDPIPDAVAEDLCALMSEANESGALNIQLMRNEPKAFDTPIARYGSFDQVNNYLAIVGTKGEYLDERCGYFGEALVLRAQQLGLNSCWVGLSYRRGAVPCLVKANEKLVCVIALGYGVDNGHAHKVKPLEKLCAIAGNQEMPTWFLQGLEAAQLAPTALNQQKFRFVLREPDAEQRPRVRPEAGMGPYTRLDLGIAIYHFQQIAGPENFIWA